MNPAGDCQYVLDTLAVGTARAAAGMHERGWLCVCVADDLPTPPFGKHFPLEDGSGSDPLLIGAALNCVRRRLEQGQPTFVYCRHGRNRSVCVAAAALAISGQARWFAQGLRMVSQARPLASPRDDTLAEVLAVVLKLRPAGPNHE